MLNTPITTFAIYLIEILKRRKTSFIFNYNFLAAEEN